VRVWHWICGVKRKPKAVNKPLHYFIVPERDKPGSSATVSSDDAVFTGLAGSVTHGHSVCHQVSEAEEIQWR
jgi:hypothetical protein